MIRSILLFLLFPCIVFCEIRECSTIKDMACEATPDTLLIFDIDNTLYRTVQMLGSDEWFYSHLSAQQKKTKDKEEALNTCLDLLHAIQAVTQVQPMEPCTASVVKQLQEQGYTVMALTTRGPQIGYTTLRQLDSIGIDMRKSPPTTTSFYLETMAQVQFLRGVLFTNGQHKGKALSQFLRQATLKPKRIVFINDKLAHIKEVAQIESEGIEFLGLRYSGSDEHVKKFNPDVAEMQLNFFLNLLSDASAQILQMQKVKPLNN